MSRSLLVVVNPISGTISKERAVRQVVDSLKKGGYDVKIYHTTGPGDAIRIARQAASEGYYGVVACGGDGTVNEVGTGLLGTNTALGIIPMGSGNGLARHLQIPLDPRSAARVIRKDKVLDCDCGSVNGKPFFCTFGVGFDADVSHNFAHRRGRGLVNYLKSIVDTFQTHKPATYNLLSSNGELVTEKAFLVACANASQYGNNAYIAPGASIRDGKLDVTIVHPGTPLQSLRLGAELIAGLLYNNNSIDSYRTDFLAIGCPHAGSVKVHLDGEPITMRPPLEVRCLAGRIKIFVPTRTTRFIPIITPIYCNTRNALLAIGSIFDYPPHSFL